MVIDKQIKAIVREAVRLFTSELRTVIREVLRTELETAEEKWLTKEELCAQFGCFSPDWINRHGDLLPRTQIVLTEANGKECRSRWCYPMHKINRMLQDGSIKSLTH